MWLLYLPFLVCVVLVNSCMHTNMKLYWKMSWEFSPFGCASDQVQVDSNEPSNAMSYLSYLVCICTISCSKHASSNDVPITEYRSLSNAHTGYSLQVLGQWAVGLQTDFSVTEPLFSFLQNNFQCSYNYLKCVKKYILNHFPFYYEQCFII